MYKTLLLNRIYKRSTTYYCHGCDLPLESVDDAVKHSFEKKHKNRTVELEKRLEYGKVEEFNSIDENQSCKFISDGIYCLSKPFFYRCCHCEAKLSSTENALDHLKSPHHKSMKDTAIANLSRIEKISRNESKIKFFRNKRFRVDVELSCPICKVRVYDENALMQHFRGKIHQRNLWKAVLTDAKTPYYCSLCEKGLSYTFEVENHFQTMEHKQKKSHIKHGINFGNSTHIEDIDEPSNFNVSVDLGFNEMSSHSIESNEDISQLQYLIQLEEPYDAGRNVKTSNHYTDPCENSPGNKVSYFGSRYVKLCLEPGDENIYNISLEKVRLLNFGLEMYYKNFCVICQKNIPKSGHELYEHLLEKDHLQKIDLLDEKPSGLKILKKNYSELDLAKDFIIKYSKSSKCLCCGKVFTGSQSALKNHIESKEHALKREGSKRVPDEIFNEFRHRYEHTWYYVQQFFCAICKFKFNREIDFAKHVDSHQHLTNKICSEFDMCLSCGVFWFGHSDIYASHCSSTMHKYIMQCGEFQVTNMSIPTINLLESFEESTEKLVGQMNKAIIFETENEHVLRSIEEAVSWKYPLARAFVFGSKISSLNFHDTDMLIYLDCGIGGKESLLEVESCFLYSANRKYFWSSEEVLASKGRKPHIKIRHNISGMKCEISIINGLEVANLQLVRSYSTAHPTCRKMILFIEKWLSLCHLSGSLCISFHAISWCVIFYLQTLKILPSVSELVKLRSNSRLINGWETSTAQDKIIMKPSETPFKELLKGFFTYYADFDYKLYVISPYLGRPIEKQAFENTFYLPDEMAVYKRHIVLRDIEKFQIDSPLGVQHPFDLSQNMTKLVSKLDLRSFKRYCSISVKNLSSC